MREKRAAEETPKRMFPRPKLFSLFKPVPRDAFQRVIDARHVLSFRRSSFERVPEITFFCAPFRGDVFQKKGMSRVEGVPIREDFAFEKAHITLSSSHVVAR